MASFFKEAVRIMYRPSATYHEIQKRYQEDRRQKAHYLIFVLLGVASAFLALVATERGIPNSPMNASEMLLVRIVVVLVFALAGSGSGAIEWCARASISHLLMRVLGRKGEFDELLVLSSYAFLPNLLAILLITGLYACLPGLSELNALSLPLTGYGFKGVALLINIAASLFSIYLLFLSLKTVYNDVKQVQPLLVAGLSFVLSLLVMIWPNWLIPKGFFGFVPNQ
jgi:hypothetical protein